MPHPLSRSVLAALLALTVVAGGFTGAAAAASAGSIQANPPTPNATSTHSVTTTVGTAATGSWGGFAVGYPSGDASNVSLTDVKKIGIDRGADSAGTAIDVNVSDDLNSVSASNNGKTLTFDLGGSYSIKAGDELVVVYGNVTNPASSGQYNVSLDINHQSSGGESTATLTIGNEASLSFSDQETDGKSVVVDDVTLPEGGYVVIHEATDGGPGAVLGHSQYLEPGTYKEVDVTLDSSLSKSQDLVAMAHRETNANGEYDFPNADGPYVKDGSAVTDRAMVTLATAETTTTTTTAETTTTTTEATTTTTTTEGGGPGFGIAAALVALVGAALLAVRRT